METGIIPSLNAPIVAIAEAARSSYVLPEIAPAPEGRSVRIIENVNPFRVEQRRVILIAPLDNESVAAIVTRAGLPLDEYMCSVNGYRIADEDLWREPIFAGQEIVLYPRVAGGKMWSMVAMLAFTAVMGVLTSGGWIAGTLAWMGAGAGLIGAAGYIGSALTLAGSMLISWAFQPGQASAPAWSASYDPTGPKGLAQPGVPVPKAYGTMGWCGNVISSYVTFDGNDAYINSLVCYGWGQAISINQVLINQQPISVFKECTYNVRLGTNNQTSIDGFDRTVNGYPVEQEMLVSAGPIIIEGTGTNVQGLDITVKFPSGLYRCTNDGNDIPLQFIYKIEIAPFGGGTWTTPLMANATVTAATIVDDVQVWPAWVVMPTDRFAGSGIVYATDNGSHTPGDPWAGTDTVTITNLDGSTGSTSVTLQGEWQPCDPNLSPVLVTSWWEGYRIVRNDTTAAFFDTVSIYGLTAGQWNVRLTKIGYNAEGNDGVGLVYADSTSSQNICDGWFWNVNEIFFSNLCYPNMVLVGIKALATSQLNGGSLQVQANIVHGLGPDTVIPAALDGYETDNPAIICYDLLTNPLYGMGIAASNIDLPAFAAWASFNDELVTNQDGSSVRRHIFNGVFDQAGDAWHALTMIAGMSRASIVQIGMRYSVVLDAPADPVQLFTVGNMKKDSFVEQWVALDDRCTLIECDFADAARNYRMDLPVSVMTEADINSGLQPKITRTKLTGCTSRDQAWRWAYFHLMSTKLTLRTIQFGAPIEAVCCQIGSVIGVQSDVVQWGVGGRVQSGSTINTLNVDRTDLTFATGSGWTVSVQHPSVERGTATISAISGLNVGMTASLPSGRITKLVGVDGTEYIVTGYAGSTVTVASITSVAAATPLAAAQVVTLYDTNVIDTIDATAVAVTPASSSGPGVSVVTVSSNFSAVPIADSAWAYGQSAGAQPAKLFRVISVKRSGDFAFDIGAMEYNAEIYEDVTPNYGEIVGVPNAVPAITNLTLTEQYQNGTLTGSINSAVVSVGWMNGNTGVGGQVQVQAGTNGTWNTLGNIQGTGCTFVGAIGTTYNVSVTGFDWQGNLLGAAVTASITVVASTNAPANVTGFGGLPSSTSTVLSWNAVSPTPDHYEIRWALAVPPSTWATAAVLWDGSGTSWIDTTLRGGAYMIVAVTSLASGAIESVIPAIWQSTASPSIPITGGGGTLTMGAVTATGSSPSVAAPSGTVSSGGGATGAIPTASSSFSPLVLPGQYYSYAWLDASLVWDCNNPSIVTSGIPSMLYNVPTQLAAGYLIFLVIWNFYETIGSTIVFGGGSMTIASS